MKSPLRNDGLGNESLHMLAALPIIYADLFKYIYVHTEYNICIAEHTVRTE